MSIRVRLALFGVALAGLALLFASVLLDRLAAAGAPAEQDKQLSAAAERAVQSISGVTRRRLTLGVPPIVTDPRSSSEQFVAVVDDAGTILFSSADLDGLEGRIPESALEEAKTSGTATATITTDSGVEVRVSLRRWSRPDLGLSGVVIAEQPTAFNTEQVEGVGGSALLSRRLWRFGPTKESSGWSRPVVADTVARDPRPPGLGPALDVAPAGAHLRGRA